MNQSPPRCPKMLLGSRILQAIALCPIFCLACSSPPPPSTESQTHLDNAAIARVGSQIISVHAVAKVAAAQHLSPAQARTKLIHDALFAEEALSRSMNKSPAVQTQQRGVVASALILAIKNEAAQTPVTPEELSNFTQLHWLDLDRPVAMRTVHAVVQVPENADESKRKRAFDLASRIAIAVQTITDPKDFISTAEAVPADGLEIVAEQLPPITADGRAADLINRPPPNAPPQQFDTEFATAAHHLKNVGDTSAPEKSAFGWHVIRLLEIQPAKQLSDSARLEILREEIFASRAKIKLDALIESQREKLKPSIERNAENNLSTVQLNQGAER